MASKVPRFRTRIFTWWKKNKRDLPWRRTNDPYHIMVSEVMLQQTQVSRVLPKYAEFLAAFPTLETLAQATPARILRVWRGMGYNRRALYLHKTAQSIVRDYRGVFPKTEKELVRLPGLGRYTARAILVFAFRQDIAMVDTNIRRIITHFFFNGVQQKESVIQQTADRLLPKGKSWEWHQALMDYGSLALPRTMNHQRRTNEAFMSSNRYYRGRIVDRLREGPVSNKTLYRELAKPPDFLETIVHGLMRDGLVIATGKGVLRLPE